MSIALSEKKLFSTKSIGEIASSLLIFLYFFTSGADKLNFSLAVFKGKVNNFFALLLFAGFCIIYKKIYLRASLLIPSIHLFLAIIISAFFSPYVSRSFGYSIVFLIEFTLYFLLSYNLIIQCDETAILKKYFLAFWIVGLHGFLQLFFSLFGIIDPFVGQYIGRLARPHSFFYEPSYYALYMSCIVMYLSAKIMIDDDGRLFRKDLVSLFFIHLLFLLSTSTGAFISYFFLIPTLLGSKILFLRRNMAPYFYRKSGFLFVSFAQLMCGAFLIFPNIFYVYFFKFFNSGFYHHHSFKPRWDGIVRAWEVFTQFPFFGKGIGGIGAHYYYQENAHLQGMNLSLAELEIYDPTNSFTEILGTLGLFGMLAILTFLFFFFKEMRAIARLSDQFRKEKIIALSLIISWIVTLLVLQFNQGLFRNYLWIHSGIVLGYTHKLLLRAGIKTSQM